jgi:hypothetical protein
MIEYNPNISTSHHDQISSPIFVGGENRSGTTLMGVKLNAHPDVVMGSEIDFVSPSFERIQSGELGEGEVRFLRHIGRFGVSADQMTLLLTEELDQLGRIPLSYQERCLLMRRMGRYRAYREDYSRWGFQIQRQIGNAELIELALVGAKFVHVIRDGRDVAASHLKLTEKAWTYKKIEDAAEGWSSHIRKVSKQEADIIDVRYEDLILDQEQTLSILLGNLALAWSVDVINHDAMNHDLLNTPHDHPSAIQVSRPSYADSIGSYKKILSKEQVRVFEKIAGNELEQFGYK